MNYNKLSFLIMASIVFSQSIAIASEPFHMVVIGDSIAWGAGLEESHKYYSLVRDWIAEEKKIPIGSIEVEVLAHTGATLCTENYDPIRPSDLSSGNPTIAQQADMISSPSDVDLILVSGGINDIGVDNIIKLDHLTSLTGQAVAPLIGAADKTVTTATGIVWNPIDLFPEITYSEAKIRERTPGFETPMRLLLNRLIKDCPNARIVVTSYYPIVSKDSKGLTETIKALMPTSQDIKDYQNLDDPDRKRQLEDKSDVFYKESTESLSAAVNDAKSDSGDNRAAFAHIEFSPENCYGTDESLLWKIGNIGGQIKTDDNLFDARMSLLNDLGWVCACEQCLTSPGTKNPDDVDCDIYRRNKFVAVGHPNENGAIRYKEAIIKTISDTWPNWLNNKREAPPIVQAFQVTPHSLAVGESLTIDYTVSDSHGSGLKQVELWRKDEEIDWQEINTNTLAGENGPLSGSFTDSPSSSGKYWYGIHVVDNVGNWNDEKNSNTNGLPNSFESVVVEVKDVTATKMSSQSPIEEWNRTFGGKSTDCANSVYPIPDGGYIIAGYKGFYWNMWLVKTDSEGNELWNRTFGGKGNDCANSVYPTPDGGYIIAGYRYDFGADEGKYAWLIKTDSGGNEIWNRTLSLADGNCAFSIHPTPDDGYIISGIRKYFKDAGAYFLRTWLIKTDSEGNELWNRTFDGTSADEANSVRLTLDGGYVLAGSKYSQDFENYQASLIKVDADGNELWNRTFGGRNESIAHSVLITSDGGYVLAGKTYPRRSDLNALLIKTDSEGNELWNRTFGGFNGDLANSVQATPDGGFILAGLTTIGGYEKALIIKTDSEGNELLNKTIGGKSHDSANSLQPTPDGGYILAGMTYSYGAGSTDAWLIKLGPP